MPKIVIVLLSEAVRTNQPRASHALMWAKDFNQNGIETKLFFDGAGTGWVKTLADPGHRFNARFREMIELGLISGVCYHCSKRHGDRELTRKEGIPLLEQADGHIDIASLLREGYQLVCL